MRHEFPWGNEFDASLANTCETAIFNTTPVGMFPGGVSAFGVHDLAGNVEEYVADNYAAYAGGSEVDDHLKQIHGSYRVARGGSFARFRDLARTRRRHGHNPRSATYAMGFRLAESR
jgi:formylglycine-generating enzyme required for sulfatase activity